MNVTTIGKAMIKNDYAFDHVGDFYTYLVIDPDDIAGCDEIEYLSDKELDDASFWLLTTEEDKLNGHYYLSFTDATHEVEDNTDLLFLIDTGEPKNKDEIDKNTNEVIAVFERCFKPVDPSTIQLELVLV